jgi:predicted DNA binding CopG/RHH family protein
MKLGGFDWDSGNLPKCLGHGVSLAEIEAFVRGDVCAMSKKFPDFKSDDEVDAWLQTADLTEYDLSAMKKVRFELARKDTSISLRLPAALHATLKAEAAKANMPTQRLIRMLLEAQLAKISAKTKTPRKPAHPTARSRKRAA